MTRGRKKIKGANNEVFSIRISQEQKEVLNKNVWIKNELIKYVREYLQIFVQK